MIVIQTPRGAVFVYTSPADKSRTYQRAQAAARAKVRRRYPGIVAELACGENVNIYALSGAEVERILIERDKQL